MKFQFKVKRGYVMTPFSVLVIGHLIGDFLFQTNWIAKYKATRWFTLIVHVFIYTTVITILDWLTFHSLSILGILLLFVTHLIIDRQTAVRWWMKYIMRTDPDLVLWLRIVVDQIFHVIVLAAALLL